MTQSKNVTSDKQDRDSCDALLHCAFFTLCLIPEQGKPSACTSVDAASAFGIPRSVDHHRCASGSANLTASLTTVRSRRCSGESLAIA